ncbi:MAG: hemolysin family protein [Phycisphaerae bacterium]
MIWFAAPDRSDDCPCEASHADDRVVGGRAGNGARYREITATVSPYFWVVLISAALSLFFSVASYALRGFRRIQLDNAHAGEKIRRKLELLDGQLPALTLTSATCRAIANLALVTGMLYLLAGIGGGWARTAGALVATGLLIALVSVAIPHAWATYAGGGFLLAALPLLLALRYALFPLIAAMQALSVPIRRLSGAEEEHECNGEEVRQEILQAASEGRAEGSVNAEEAQMIEAVVEFSEIQAGQIMTPRTDVFALPAEVPWHEACAKVFDAGHTRVPVYQQDIDNIIGVLYAKDLLQHVRTEQPVSVREIMRKPFFVPETMTLDKLLREFKARKVHLAVVLDEYGGTAGLVTIEDVLEEIVGNISDEYDRPEPALMHRVDEQTAEVDGRLHIDDLNDAMGLDIPEDEDYDTAAGCVFSELGYIPAAGENVRIGGAEFTILEADDRKIIRLRVRRLDTEQVEPD